MAVWQTTKGVFILPELFLLRRRLLLHKAAVDKNIDLFSLVLFIRYKKKGVKQRSNKKKAADSVNKSFKSKHEVRKAECKTAGAQGEHTR